MKLTEIAVAGGAVLLLWVAAMPQFRNADTVSEVAEMRARLRTIGGAIEAYRSDNGQLPLNPMDGGGSRWYAYLPNSLTTPTAYITAASIMHDTFRVPPVVADPPDVPSDSLELFNRIHYVNHLQFSDLNTGSIVVVIPPSTIISPRPSGQDPVFGRKAQWSIWSYGPDHDYGPDTPTPAGSNYVIDYDPTNGTVSGGDLRLTSLRFEQPTGFLLSGPESHYDP